MKTQHYLWVLLLLTAAIPLPAQDVSYRYDQAGNRIERVITLSSSSLRSSEENAAQEEIPALEEVLAEQEIRIYPNPTHGLLFVEIPHFHSDLLADFVLADMNGKIIEQRRAASGSLTFDLSSYPNGIYLLRMNVNGEGSTWKIIKK